MIRSLIVAWLVTGCLFSCAAADSPPAPGPRLSDKQFFSMLDLTRPDLAAVRTNVAKSDWPAARHALAEHIRTRPLPLWDEVPGGVVADPRHHEAAADLLLTHLVSSLGVDWQFGTNIDWAFNPTTQPGSQWPTNHEWTWQFNRHNTWVALAHAYEQTGDEKYAREFVAELKGWVRDCPVPLDKVQNGPYSRWRTIEAGIRAGTTWPQIFPRFLPSKAFDDEAVVLMLKSFADHAEYLMRFHTTGNWLTMEANGLYHVGALFPEFKDAQLWRDTAVGRLDHELDAQVYPDGAQIELAPGYHCVAMNNFLGPVVLVASTGFKPPGDYLPKIEKMFDYLLYSMQPDFRTPPLNDSGAVKIPPIMAEGFRLFPAREDFHWAATEGREGRPPAGTSHVFPYAGQFIMRSGWEPDARWLCMDGGPFGYGHQHEDKLSVMLTAFGQPLLVEGGTYTYDASIWRRYIVSSRAHNVVLVDGLEQDRRRSPKDSYVVKSPLPQVWESNERFDHAASYYNEGWGRDALLLLKHTRHVFYLKPDVFVIADELEPLDGKPHLCEALFHLDAENAVADGLRVTTQNAGPNLTVTAFGADGLRIVKGQKEPEVQGWLPDPTLGYGGIKPIPTAIYRKTVRGKTTVLYVLYPTPAAGACPVTKASLKGDVLTVHFSDRAEQTIRFRRLPPL